MVMTNQSHKYFKAVIIDIYFISQPGPHREPSHGFSSTLPAKKSTKTRFQMVYNPQTLLNFQQKKQDPNLAM